MKLFVGANNASVFAAVKEHHTALCFGAERVISVLLNKRSKLVKLICHHREYLPHTPLHLSQLCFFGGVKNSIYFLQMLHLLMKSQTEQQQERLHLASRHLINIYLEKIKSDRDISTSVGRNGTNRETKGCK